MSRADTRRPQDPALVDKTLVRRAKDAGTRLALAIAALFLAVALAIDGVWMVALPVLMTCLGLTMWTVGDCVELAAIERQRREGPAS